ncbi:MAG: capsule biosynthesis protein, partial [Butyricimonas faecihominis]
KLLRGEIDDIPLKKNDRLYVPSATELRGDYVIDIRGEVKNPRKYPFVDNMMLEDAVLQAVGLLDLPMVRVDVSRRIKSPNSTEEAPAEAELFTFGLKNGLVVEGILEFTLEPFDGLDIVRRSRDTVNSRT